MSLSAWTRISFSGNGVPGKEQDLESDGQANDDTCFLFLSRNYTPTSTNRECKEKLKALLTVLKNKKLVNQKFLIRSSSIFFNGNTD